MQLIPKRPVIILRPMRLKRHGKRQLQNTGMDIDADMAESKKYRRHFGDNVIAVADA